MSREAPLNSTVSLTSQRNPAKLPEVMGTSRGHQVQQGAQGASRVLPGKSGLHVRGEGERIIALELW